jgi:hypothetical protein
MNIHHLELFYYVARFGGISEALIQLFLDELKIRAAQLG